MYQYHYRKRWYCCYKVFSFGQTWFWWVFSSALNWRLVFLFRFVHIFICFLLCSNLSMYLTFPMLLFVVKTMEPLCWKSAKWSIFHFFTQLNFGISQYFSFFKHIERAFFAIVVVVVVIFAFLHEIYFCVRVTALLHRVYIF